MAGQAALLSLAVRGYVVPISANFSGVFYNKDLFEAGGYEVPTTYDELIKLAEDIQSKGETPFLFPDKGCMDNCSVLGG